MDIKSAKRYAEARSVIDQAMESHEPITIAEQRRILETTPLERFNALWQSADHLLGAPSHNRGTIIAKSKTEGGVNIWVALTLREVTSTRDQEVLITRRVIEADWKANGYSIGGTELASDDPNFLAKAASQDTEQARNLALIEESVEAAKIIQWNGNIPPIEPLVYLVRP